jgi:formylglycine-generating enzyme required for sulfatase activity
MGSPGSEKDRRDDEGPVHRVTISYPLAVSKYPVTGGLWRQYLLQKTGKSGSNNCAGRIFFGPEHVWRDPGFTQEDNHPVFCVSWNEAQGYASWLTQKTGYTYRLPSEAEWEYSARAGTTTAYYWGEELGRGHANCNSCGSQWDGKQTAPVGSFGPNSWGLYDMLGNVNQWTQDCYHKNYDDAPTNGSAWVATSCSYRVLRGASWHDTTMYVRAAHRFQFDPSGELPYVGFRVARIE